MVFVTGTTPMHPHTELMSAPHPPFMLNRYNSKLPLQAYLFRADLNPQAVYAPPGPFSQDHVVTRGSVSILNSGKLWASKVKALKLISLFPRLFYCLLFYVVSLRGWMYAVMWRPPSWENEGWMLCPQNRLDFLCEPHGAPAPVKILIRVCKALST